MNQQQEQEKRLKLRYVELLLLAITLLATVIISALTLRQTTEHFKIERTSAFVARFNSSEMIAVREVVDTWLAEDESPAQLFDRSQLATEPVGITPDTREGQIKASPVEILASLRTMANFFQEFGTALKIGSLDETYAHELLGALSVRYTDALEPFIMETRRRMDRQQLYEEVIFLRTRMKALDE